MIIFSDLYYLFRSAFHVSWKNQNKNLTLNSSFDALSKWHEPDINLIFCCWSSWNVCILFLVCTLLSRLYPSPNIIYPGLEWFRRHESWKETGKAVHMASLQGKCGGQYFFRPTFFSTILFFEEIFAQAEAIFLFQPIFRAFFQFIVFPTIFLAYFFPTNFVFDKFFFQQIFFLANFSQIFFLIFWIWVFVLLIRHSKSLINILNIF